MASSLWWFYDALTVAILIIAVYGGAKKGLTKLLSSLIVYVVAVLVAYLGAVFLAPSLYNSTISDNAQQKLTAQIQSYDTVSELKQALDSQFGGISIDAYRIRDALTNENDTVANNLVSVIVENKPTVRASSTAVREQLAIAFNNTFSKELYDVIPGFMVKELEAAVQEADGVQLDRIIRAVYNATDNDAAKLARSIELEFSLPTSVALLKNVIFIVVFLVAVILLTILLKGKTFLDPYLLPKPVNLCLGGLFGIAEGFVTCILMVMIVRALVMVGDNQMMFINIKTIEQTFVFKVLYLIDILQ